MLDILFLDNRNDHVNYAVTNVVGVRYVTASEIGFTYRGGRNSSCPFPQTERIEIVHTTNSPRREVSQSA